MSDNIEKVLSRGEKLDLLVDKTDNLMFEVRHCSQDKERRANKPCQSLADVAWQLCYTAAPLHRRPHMLHLQADRFVKSGRALRRKMWWNNLKMKIVMGVAVVMVLLIVFLLICFGGACHLQSTPGLMLPGAACCCTVVAAGADTSCNVGELLCRAVTGAPCRRPQLCAQALR